MKLEFGLQILGKPSYIKSIGICVCPCNRTDGRTDGHDETKSHLSQFCRITKELNGLQRRHVPSYFYDNTLIIIIL
jgi:hypothetical protein